ncbi:MAG: hypothetical protein NTW17_00465 [Candidatus Pacearchaeota archaeon]|nr:hypothetical protein [Candidatus Pacearchaeota archaeon]
MKYINEKKRAGWDDLYEDCFEGINKIIEDNLELKHDETLIKAVFPKMIKALEKAIIRMKDLNYDELMKKPWFAKAQNISEFSKNAETVNKKVISINMIDQFLRATY